MSNSMALTAQELGRDFPSYQVWYVPRALGPVTWHARRWDAPADPAHTLNATSSSELLRLLEAEASK